MRGMDDETYIPIERKTIASKDAKTLDRLRDGIYERRSMKFSAINHRPFAPYLASRFLHTYGMEVSVMVAAQNIAGMAGASTRGNIPLHRKVTLLNNADVEELAEPLRKMGNKPEVFDPVKILGYFSQTGGNDQAIIQFLSWPTTRWMMARTPTLHKDRFRDVTGPYLIGRTGVLFADKQDAMTFRLRAS